MTQSSQILEKAKSFIGTKEHPKNSNNVIFNTVYYNKAVSGAKYPWCCVFIWYVFYICNLSNLFFDGKKVAGCEAFLTWAKNNNLVTKTPKPGDLVLFQFDKDIAADHIGFYLCANVDGSFQTIEGNTSIGNNSNGGEVMERTRTLKQVKAFVKIEYKDTIEQPQQQTNSNVWVNYTLEQFRKDIQTLTNTNTPQQAHLGTITINSKTNTKSKFIIPLKKALKAWGCYTGDWTKQSWDVELKNGINKFQKEQMGLKKVDGEITTKGGMWKKLLGI